MSGVDVLVFGRGGQVADEIARQGAGGERRLQFLGPEEFDLLRFDPAHAIARVRPAAVINAAAYTAVDRAEMDVDAARRLNATVVASMATAAAAAGVPFVHISTDYVFDGAKAEPYREDDPKGPLGVYGQTKLEGEEAVLAAGGAWTIFRTAWVISGIGNNFVKTMIRLAGEREEVGVVADQHGRPTHAADIASLCLRAVDDPRARGLFHLAGADDATWADVAEHVFLSLERRGRRRPRLRRITTADYPTPARRPANSRLDTSRLQRALGWAPRPWRSAVDLCLDELLGTAA